MCKTNVVVVCEDGKFVEVSSAVIDGKRREARYELKASTEEQLAAELVARARLRKAKTGRRTVIRAKAQTVGKYGPVYGSVVDWAIVDSPVKQWASEASPSTPPSNMKAEAQEQLEQDNQELYEQLMDLDNILSKVAAGGLAKLTNADMALVLHYRGIDPSGMGRQELRRAMAACD